jgi:hypothetical protein
MAVDLFTTADSTAAGAGDLDRRKVSAFAAPELMLVWKRARSVLASSGQGDRDSIEPVRLSRGGDRLATAR